MRKIPTVFVREMDGRRALATPEVNPECQWVLDGEGRATYKWDGTACLIRDGRLYKRHKLTEGKPMLEGWIHWSFDPEVKHGHGWLPVGEGPEDRWHREAETEGFPDGTYELVGPRIQQNPHGFEREDRHELRLHGDIFTASPPVDFEGFRDFLEGMSGEGLVFHHPDGRMAKIKRRDFGFPWPIKERAE